MRKPNLMNQEPKRLVMASVFVLFIFEVRMSPEKRSTRRSQVLPMWSNRLVPTECMGMLGSVMQRSVDGREGRSFLQAVQDCTEVLMSLLMVGQYYTCEARVCILMRRAWGAWSALRMQALFVSWKRMHEVL